VAESPPQNDDRVCFDYLWPRASLPDGHGFVYFATTPARPGQVKIGRTNHVARRMQELANLLGHPVRARAIFTSDNCREAERAVHAAHAELRLRTGYNLTEWFRCEGPLARFDRRHVDQEAVA
jgi:hypothetical protein